MNTSDKFTSLWEEAIENHIRDLDPDALAALIEKTQTPVDTPELDAKQLANAALVRRARGVNVAGVTKQTAAEAKAKLDQLFSGKDRK